MLWSRLRSWQQGRRAKAFLRGGGDVPFLRAVHYFGDAQPINFWENSDQTLWDSHFAQIRDDGFNAIILVVPWRGFQLRLEDDAAAFDEVNLGKLGALVKAADRHRLYTILRVGFPWSGCPRSEGDYESRILGLFSCLRTQAAWRAYLRRLAAETAHSTHFLFAFFSWEDLPSLRHRMIYCDLDRRCELARQLGFDRYLARQVRADRIAGLFDSPPGDTIPIPLPSERAYPYFNDFVNQCHGELLAQSRAVWPRMSMQIRADFEQVTYGQAPEFIANDLRLDDPLLRVSYYFLYMNARNQGETLAAGEALHYLRIVLERVTGGGVRNNHFLDQFVFYDESPQFPHWPRIADGELAAFLKEGAKLVRRYARGYGLWHYFDYRDNHFYNCRFERGWLGWDRSDNATLRRGAAQLAPGAWIEQSIVPELAGNASYLYQDVWFEARTSGEAQLRVLVDGQFDGECEARSGVAATVLSTRLHQGDAAGVVTIRNVSDAPVVLTSVCLWGFVMRTHIYDEGGTAGRMLEPVRAMNRS